MYVFCIVVEDFSPFYPIDSTPFLVRSIFGAFCFGDEPIVPSDVLADVLAFICKDMNKITNG